jgi:hypothetical protein
VRRGSGQIVNDWRATVKAHKWPASTRVFKATALQLADLANPDGTLQVRREVMVSRLALPRRTVDHHLQRLIELAWLRRERRPIVQGCNAGPAVFTLAIPQDHMQPVAPDLNRDHMQPATHETALITCKLVASSLDSANVSEHVALEADAAGEPGTAVMASAAPTTRLSDSRNEEGPEQLTAVASFPPTREPDDITRAARVLEAHGLLHRDRSLRLVHDSAVAS